jgi:hypothetical protein
VSDEGTSVEFDTNTNLVAAKVAIVGGGRGGRGTIHGMSIGGQQLPLGRHGRRGDDFDARAPRDLNWVALSNGANGARRASE